MRLFKVWLVSFLSLAVLDLLWIHWLAAGFYLRYLAPLSNLNSAGGINFHVLPGVIVYSLMALSMAVFLGPFARLAFWKFVGISALLGFIIYGAFDCTNLSFMAYWPLHFALADIVWGTATFAITGAVLKGIAFKN